MECFGHSWLREIAGVGYSQMTKSFQGFDFIRGRRHSAVLRCGITRDLRMKSRWAQAARKQLPIHNGSRDVRISIWVEEYWIHAVVQRTNGA
jgi:hypothetical protein